MPKKKVLKKKVAVFDIDGTIFRSSLLIEITDALIRDGFFSQKVKKEYAVAYQRWFNRQDSYEKYIWQVVLAFKKNIKGLRRQDFMRVARQVVKSQEHRVYRYTRDLIKELKKKKYYLLAISHSPKDIVEMFGGSLGFDKMYGWMYEVDARGRFTGETLYSDIIIDKAKILKRAVLKENLTLRGSFGVGDSEGDISLLKIVDHPIAFNPNNNLYSQAKRRGWKTVVERKDVIYKF